MGSLPTRWRPGENSNAAGEEEPRRDLFVLRVLQPEVFIPVISPGRGICCCIPGKAVSMGGRELGAEPCYVSGKCIFGVTLVSSCPQSIQEELYSPPNQPRDCRAVSPAVQMLQELPKS